MCVYVVDVALSLIECERGTPNCHQYCSDTVDCCLAGFVGGDGDSCVGESI